VHGYICSSISTSAPRYFIVDGRIGVGKTKRRKLTGIWYIKMHDMWRRKSPSPSPKYGFLAVFAFYAFEPNIRGARFGRIPKYSYLYIAAHVTGPPARHTYPNEEDDGARCLLTRVNPVFVDYQIGKPDKLFMFGFSSVSGYDEARNGILIILYTVMLLKKVSRKKKKQPILLNADKPMSARVLSPSVI